MVQTGKITNYPIVLIGTSFWGPLVEWMHEHLVGEGMISPQDMDLFVLTDSAAAAVDAIVAAHNR